MRCHYVWNHSYGVPVMETSSHLLSWGRFPNVKQTALFQNWHTDPIPSPNPGTTILPRGMGRSYGDSCLNENNCLLLTRRLDRFLHLDEQNGILKVECGITLDELLKNIVPKGWFLPVVPGTKFITVGGAIANDIHGKNHHGAGSFGNHVSCFELLRSNGERYVCSPTKNPDWFRATVGGLGLTGLITWAEIRLRPISSPYIEEEILRLRGLSEFFEVSRRSEGFDYTVAWVDCLKRGSALGRGLFLRGNHLKADRGSAEFSQEGTSKKVKNIGFDAPNFALNPLTVRLFNTVYYHKQRVDKKEITTHYDSFFFPLDSIGDWNRIYGKRGFLQYQFVVPLASAEAIVTQVIDRIAHARMGSFLSVLKVFGGVSSMGLLSFPRPGVTLALDFPIAGSRLFRLLSELDGWVLDAGGALYAAKDSRMSEEAFKLSHPEWKRFLSYIDPLFSSSFARRVGLI